MSISHQEAALGILSQFHSSAKGTKKFTSLEDEAAYRRQVISAIISRYYPTVPTSKFLPLLPSIPAEVPKRSATFSEIIALSNALELFLPNERPEQFP